MTLPNKETRKMRRPLVALSFAATSLAADGPPAAYSDPSIVHSFAQAVEQNMQRQLADRVQPGTTCLVTSLEDVDAASTATTNGMGDTSKCFPTLTLIN